MWDAHAAQLRALADADRLRALAPRAGIDFSSNDYLGLAGSDRLRDAARAAIDRGIPVGSGGSRLLRGNHPEHEALEAEAADFFGSETALFLPTGYAANSALLATLPQTGDLIVHDERVHASSHEGMRLTRATSRSFPHNDAAAADAAIAAWRRTGGTGTPWIAVESLYSMDGDRAPLDDLAAVAARHDAMLVVDEAHATGVFGTDGGGLAAALGGAHNLITLHTCGKAMGVEGALVALPRTARDFLVNRARGFIFSTAPSPLSAALVRASLRILADAPELRTELHGLIAVAGAQLPGAGASQIVPVILGEDARAMRVAAGLRERGFDIRGIRPPTVAPGTARLRISITRNVDATQIATLGDAIRELTA
ncbi:MULTISPECIES: 8-amino-7-oxononanoate synthase [unclassified Sphingomonas]|uniref:8-amino-7-oxononanoate synthase n=1 Tax=unclassified Sphingomonas TaxID=196159 RepID=UPI00082FC2A7|nr:MULTISPECIES: 8-amino-7-oxononanoate synthase [unclassified Sphingomonas]MCH4893925.1 aminotransferase class I/II-fold pyridoxal phosphate-dependent enzyme [Sphingomonas sp. SFZ2018-12]